MFPPELDDIDDDDPRLERFSPVSCTQVRRKIRSWIDSGAMKVGEFQNKLGVSSPAYHRFMNKAGPWDGQECDTYWSAHYFFAKRQLLGLPMTLPKPKKVKTSASTNRAPTTAASAATAAAAPAAGAGAKKAGKADDKVARLLDTCDDIVLPGEGTPAGVPVFDTCAEVRKRLRALMARDDVSKSAVYRALSRMIPGDTPVSAQNMQTFMGQPQVMDGNTSKSFYAAYLLFEKQRLRDGRPKSAFRREMERAHGPGGVDRERNHRVTGVFCAVGQSIGMDKYGKIHTW
jgi:hypothetical protein